MNEAKYIGLRVLRAPSLSRNPMPPRTTRKSDRPRVPDRTMVDIFNHTACPRQKPKASSHREMISQRRTTCTTSLLHVGSMPGRKLTELFARGEVFVLTSPFIERAYRTCVRLADKSRLTTAPSPRSMTV